MSERFYPCACPCGCTATSLLPDLGSAALARHARCADCATDEHLAAFPDPAAAAAAVVPALTNLYVPSRAERALATAAQREVYEEIWTQQWDRWRASLPEKFRDADTEHSQVKERLRRLRSGQTGVASMVILGPPGTGKTFLATGYANAAIKAGFFAPSEVLFGSEAELLASVANSSFGEVEVGLRKVISRRVRMLVLDDVGRGTWLDKFWSENRVVVVTSNLSPTDLGTYIGDGAMDRLRSLAGNSSLVLDTESKRKKVTEEMLAKAEEEPEPVSAPKPRPVGGSRE